MAQQKERHNIDDSLYVFLQDNSKKWYARFQLFGKWYCKSTIQTDVEEAKAAARLIRMEHKIKLETGTLTQSKRFKDVAEKAVDAMQHELDMGGGKVAYRDYINALRKYHIPFFERTYITSIDQPKLREFEQWRIKKVGRVLAKSTILNHNAGMQMVFKVAIENQWMLPIQVPVLSNVGASGERRASLSPDEYERVCTEVANMERNSRKKITANIRRLLFYYMEFAINTGLRPGSELDQLTWGDIKIESQAHKIRFFLTVRKGKTTKFTGTREVVCNAGIFDTIWALIREFPNRKPSDLLFRLPDGNTTNELGPNFAKALENTGLKESTHGTRTLYSLRHTYITWELMSQRVSIDVLAKQCGTSISMIEQHYSHVIPRMYSNQLSGVDLSEVNEVKNRFDVPKRTQKSFAKKATEWQKNYRMRGCI